jgi:hypothetical protein
MHILVKIQFGVLVLIQLCALMLNISLSYLQGHQYSLISLFELVFPLFALLAIAKVEKNEEPVLFCLKAIVYLKIYMAWVVFSMLFLAFLTIFRAELIPLNDSLKSSASSLLGIDPEAFDLEVFQAGINEVAVQVLALIYTIPLYRSLRPKRVEYHGFI